jgi:hypothetical protein
VYERELCDLCNETSLVRMINVGLLRWLERPYRRQESSCRKLNVLHKPEATRRDGRSGVRRLDRLKKIGDSGR